MNPFRFATVVTLLAASLLAPAVSPAKDLKDRDPEEVHRELNWEYAKLYKAVSSLRMVDELLLLKFESDETEALCKQIAAFGSRAKAELEDLRKADPRISFDEDGRSGLAHEASKRQQKERLKLYAPVTGASGPDFERNLILGQASLLYLLRFRVEVMAEAETSAARAKYLRNMHKEIDQLYARTARHLDKRHFREGARTPLGAAGEID